MKKVLAIFVALLLPLVSLLGCGGNAPSLSLSENNISMTLFGEKEIVASYENITEGITWENSDEKIIKLETYGNTAKLIAVGSGIATITAKGGELSESCTVLVADTSEKLSLTTGGYNRVSLRKGGSIYVPAKVTFEGEEFEKAQINYEISDTSVATVDDEGIVTGVGKGDAVLTVYAEYYGSVSNRIELQVEVQDGPFLKINTANLNLYVPTASDELVNEFSVTVSLMDGENEIENIDYTSENSNPEAASFSDGVIKGIAAGETIITISYTYNDEEYTAKIFVNVKNPPTVKLELINDRLSLYDSSPLPSYITSSQLIAVATIDGKTVANSELSWKVDAGSDVVSVSSTGVVKALKKGDAKVSVNYSFAGLDYSDVCDVSVYAPVGYVDTHKNWDRSGIFTTIFAGTQLSYNDMTLTDSKDSVFIRFNIVPDNPIVNKYVDGDKLPKDPDTRTQRNLRMFYITLTEAENPENSITIAVRVYLEGDGFYAETTGARVGVRASTYPSWTPGGVGTNNFYGAFEGDAGHVNVPMGISGGWASSASFSFFGAFLDDTTDKYTLGFSIEGTTLYYHNNDKVTKVWDLKEDTIAYAKKYPTFLNESNVWNGFETDKVNVTIRGDYYDTSSFNLMITDLGGSPVTAETAEKIQISSLV